MKMKKNVFVICVMFVVLLAGCSSSPKLFVPKESTVNMPNVGKVQYQEMLIYIDEPGRKYTLGKTAVPEVEGLFGYTISVDAIDSRPYRACRQEIARMKATPGVRLRDLYAIPEGPFTLIIDGETYSLDDFSVTTSDYVVYAKHAGLGKTRKAILDCSQLSIDGGEIRPNGIAAIKKFIEITPIEVVRDALQSME
jgi:hypothetical protein